MMPVYMAKAGGFFFMVFGVTALIYAGAVRPWPWIRPLFGLKPLPPRSAALPASTTAL